MKLIDIGSGGFRLWFKLCLIVAVHLGFAWGLCTLIFALVGAQAYAGIFGLELRGVPAGLVNLVWCPLLASGAAAFLSVIAYWPFRMSCRLLSGS